MAVLHKLISRAKIDWLQLHFKTILVLQLSTLAVLATQPSLLACPSEHGRAKLSQHIRPQVDATCGDLNKRSAHGAACCLLAAQNPIINETL